MILLCHRAGLQKYCLGLRVSTGVDDYGGKIDIEHGWSGVAGICP